MVSHRFFVTVFLLLRFGSLWVLGDDADQEEEEEDKAPVPSVEDLDGMIAYLRHDDERLIRYNVPSELAWLRQEKLCSQHLETIMNRLLDDRSKHSLEDQSRLVQLVTLCSSENPDNRQKIGTFRDSGVLRTIVSMLDEDALHAVVGDAVWILSFNNQHNHDYFVEHALEPMASVLVSRARSLEDASEGSGTALAVMWMAAGLQNLAASYCATDSGHCWWEYEFPDDDEEEPEGGGDDYGLYLHDESPLVIDAAGAAAKLARSAELVPVLHRLVCAAPMAEADEAIWASEATVSGSDVVDPRIVTWAVAGLLKNLSMYEGSYQIPLEARDCLCGLATQSEDWLESSKASDALYRLGIPEEDCWGHDEEEAEAEAEL